MAAPTNHWKLGLFVVVGMVMTLTTVAVLGARSLRKEVQRYVTYFDESVQGLEVGSPIKFRGVTIGTVGKIDIAPDHRHVEVTSELGVAELTRLGLDVSVGPAGRGSKKLHQDTDLRAQLNSAGLTGVKFLSLDFFLVSDNPPPLLPFQVPDNYIPAASSTMKNIEDALVRTMNRLPALADQMSGILTSVDIIVGSAKDKQLPERVAILLENASHILSEAQGKIDKVDTAKLSKKAEKVLGNLDEATNRANKILASVDSEKGLLASVGRATDAMGDTVRSADGLGEELGDTLRAVKQAANGIRKVTDALDKDPDMLLKGRNRAVEQNR